MSIPTVPIVPALIPTSANDVREFARQLTFVHEIHIDVVDGDFVPTVSWPLEPADSPLAVKPYTDAFTLEVDLMMTNPIPAARAWEQAGADMIVFHVETVDVDSLADFCKHSMASVGVAFHGETPVSAIIPHLLYVDYIQVMGIDTIGAQGQPFSDRTLEKIKTLKAQYPQVMLSVDGSVNKQTIKQIVKAGADRLIVGSAISKAADMSVAYKELVSLVND